MTQNFIIVVLSEVEDHEIDAVVLAIVGAHSFDGVKVAIKLLGQLKVARAGFRGHWEVQHVVIELQLQLINLFLWGRDRPKNIVRLIDNLSFSVLLPPLSRSVRGGLV